MKSSGIFQVLVNKDDIGLIEMPRNYPGSLFLFDTYKKFYKIQRDYLIK